MTMQQRKILIGASGEEVSEHLRKVLEKTLKSEESLVIGLSGGSLPKFFVQAVLRLESVDWNKVTFIFCDERLVPFESEDSTFKAYKEALVGKVQGITERNFVLIEPELSAEQAAKDYAKKIEALNKEEDNGSWPRFDLLLLGMGPDGHTCSLFPGHPLLQEDKLVVAPITDSPKPPPNRVTLTLPVLNNSKCVCFVSTGDGKKDILEEILDKDVDYPAARVKPTNGDLIWILDEAAAAKLKKI